mmetsp:Transcript_23038/g.65960  ORF Transcript_23038/g.65960 Transcript_23038/m.65960 type:complete len:81 (-) Transcript_23038:1179-1421(-)
MGRAGGHWPAGKTNACDEAKHDKWADRQLDGSDSVSYEVSKVASHKHLKSPICDTHGIKTIKGNETGTSTHTHTHTWRYG